MAFHNNMTKLLNKAERRLGLRLIEPHLAKIDLGKNEVKGEEAIISTDNSKIKICVVPTNEELMIAKETEKLIK